MAFGDPLRSLIWARRRVPRAGVPVPDVSHVASEWNSAAVHRDIGAGYVASLHELIVQRVLLALSSMATERRSGAHRAGLLNARGNRRVVRDLFGVPCAYVRSVLAPSADRVVCSRYTVKGEWTSLAAFASVFGDVMLVSRPNGIAGAQGAFPSGGYSCPGVRTQYTVDGSVRYIVARNCTLRGGDSVTLYNPRRHSLTVDVPAALAPPEEAITFKWSRKLQKLQLEFHVNLLNRPLSFAAVRATATAHMVLHAAHKRAHPNDVSRV